MPEKAVLVDGPNRIRAGSHYDRHNQNMPNHSKTIDIEGKGPKIEMEVPNL